MKVELGTFIDNKVEKIRELSQDEYNEYNLHWENLHEVRGDFDLLRLMNLNFESFFENIEEYMSFLEQEKKLVFDVTDIFRLQVNRHFLNFLSSFRTLLDHSETTIKRRFGKTSNEIQAFKQVCSYAYDNHFEYRFFYKLRNYAQHCGLPIDLINCTVKKEKESGDYIWTLKIEFDLDYLKSNYNEWKDINRDFANLGSTLEVAPMIPKVMSLISTISIKVKEIKQPLIDNAATFLRNLTNTDSSNFSRSFKIYLDDHVDGSTHTFTMQTVPLHLLQILR